MGCEAVRCCEAPRIETCKQNQTTRSEHHLVQMTTVPSSYLYVCRIVFCLREILMELIGFQKPIRVSMQDMLQRVGHDHLGHFGRLHSASLSMDAAVCLSRNAQN